MYYLLTEFIFQYRKCPTCPDEVSANSPDLLDCDVSKAFWLSWFLDNDACPSCAMTLRVGTGWALGHNVLMEYHYEFNDNDFNDNKWMNNDIYISVSTGAGVAGEFQLTENLGKIDRWMDG